MMKKQNTEHVVLHFPNQEREPGKGRKTIYEAQCDYGLKKSQPSKHWHALIK
jgi:hypothetical protein